VDAAQRLAAHEAVQRFMPKRAKEVQELER